MKALINVLLPALLIVVNKIGQHFNTWFWANSGLTMLNKYRWQHWTAREQNIVQCCFLRARTTRCSFLLCNTVRELHCSNRKVNCISSLQQYKGNFEENGYDDTSFISGMTEQVRGPSTPPPHLKTISLTNFTLYPPPLDLFTFNFFQRAKNRQVIN